MPARRWVWLATRAGEHFAMSLTAVALMLSVAEPSIALSPIDALTPPREAVSPIGALGAAAPDSRSITPRSTPDSPAPNLAPRSGDSALPPASSAQTDIVVTGRPRGDPLRRANVVSFKATQAVDDALIGPAAHTYEHVVPKPVRGGLRNFFYNLHEPTVFVNYLVQLKPGRAAETLGRFALNTTIGLAGVMDVAKRRPFNLPRRPNSFSDTLGYYGVKPGPFMFLPLIGPTTLRDLIGGGVDRLAFPSLLGGQVGGTAYIATTGSLKLLDRRLRLDDDLQAIRAGPEDPYTARRALYLKKRQTEIDHLHKRKAETTGVELPAEFPTDAAGEVGDPAVRPPGHPGIGSHPTQPSVPEPVPSVSSGATESTDG